MATIVLQWSEDIVAGQEVGDYVNRTVPGSRMIVLSATSHCLNLSARRSDRGHANLRELPVDQLNFQDMIEHAPCDYVSPNVRLEHINTFLSWSGHAADQMVGKRLSGFLTMAGSIY